MRIWTSELAVAAFDEIAKICGLGADAPLAEVVKAVTDRCAALDHTQALLRTQNDREASWIDLVKRLREVIINTLIDTKADNLALTDHFAIETFDEASLAVGLSISNDEGVPFELLPSAPEPAPASDELARSIADWCAANPHRFENTTIAEEITAWKASQR